MCYFLKTLEGDSYGPLGQPGAMGTLLVTHFTSNTHVICVTHVTSKTDRRHNSHLAAGTDTKS